MVGLIGALGVWLGGRFAERAEQQRCGGSIRFVALTVLLAKAEAITFYLLGDAPIALAVFVIPAALNSIYIAPASAAIYAQFAATAQPQITAIKLVLSSLIGLGLGPIIVGVISQFAPDMGIDTLGLGLVSLQMLGIWAAFHLWRAARLIALD